MPKHDLCGETWLETGSPECNCEDDMSNTDLLQKSESIEDKIDRVFNEVCDGHVPEALEDLAIEIGNALEDLRAALQPPADTRGEVCCCESPDTEPALCSNCCPVHNITPRQCDEAWLCGAAVEMLERWNAERRKAGLPTATEGSLLDGLSSLLEMLQHDKPARTPSETRELVERLKGWREIMSSVKSWCDSAPNGEVGPDNISVMLQGLPEDLGQAITALEQQAQGGGWRHTYIYAIEMPADLSAGLYGFTERVRIQVENDPGGEENEFALEFEQYLREWFDGAGVGLLPPAPDRSRNDE